MPLEQTLEILTSRIQHVEEPKLPKLSDVYESRSIAVQPESMVEVFVQSATLVPMKVEVPEDMTTPEVRRVLPKWLKVKKNTKIPPLLHRVFGWLHVTKWMRDIMADITKECYVKIMRNEKLDKRRVKREFRRRVTAYKREKMSERRNKFGSMGYQAGGEFGTEHVPLIVEELGEFYISSSKK